MRNRRKGFTLVELLVVISIIALLVSIVLPSLGKVKESARREMCQANLHNQGVGWNMYFAQSGRKIPELHRSNQLGTPQFFYVIYFKFGSGGFFNSGVPFKLKMLSVRDLACPSILTHMQPTASRAAPWWTALSSDPKDYNPDPTLLLSEPDNTISRMTYNTRRMKYYDAVADPSPSGLPDGSRNLLLQNNTLDTLGANLGNFSFIMDMNDCPDEMKMSHPPGANILWMDGHVSYFVDNTPNGTILYDNRLVDWWTPATNLAYDELWMNLDKRSADPTWVPPAN
jgi:prepilin-type N-terminal cleavage/methylation domain-containing protein/prepilin-type processing-associated H-X9-DG protein